MFGKVEVSLDKSEAGKWPNLGDPLPGNGEFCRERELDLCYRDWKLV